MSQYKVPQDVEADDKIIGPFSFRQFIYLIIVALAGVLAWWLGSIVFFLAIIPMPVIIFFGALALPLRKDQPMEIFLAAMVSFYLKPHKRLWDPDGIDSLIEITAPKTPEVQRTKDISQDEAQRRLSYLSEIVDSQGWAVRGVGVQQPNNAMRSDAYFAAQQTDDILDDNNTITQSFNTKLAKSDTDRHQAMAKIISGQPSNYFGNPLSSSAKPSATDDESIKIDYNPYPDIQQSVIQPLDAQDAAKPPAHQTAAPKSASQSATTTSDKTPSADIINLATNDDLSIATIAREANRIHEKQELQEEVVISLR